MTPYLNTILTGDSLTILKTLPDAFVQCCVTSPPYYGLRDYGIEGQIGLEETPQEYIVKLVAVFREVRRVLKDDGTLWLNIGDTYGTGTKAARTRGSRGIGVNTQSAQDAVPRIGGQAKQLMMIPARIALALQADGWYLRSDIIWHKPNCMPESVTDRPTKSHEYLFLLSKNERYYYDRVPSGRNKHTVWTINTHSYAEAHFATMPPKLIEPCILAGSRPDDLILDPFMGAGTTALVALEHQRTYLGLELNPAYVALINTRIANVQQQLWSGSEVGA